MQDTINQQNSSLFSSCLGAVFVFTEARWEYEAHHWAPCGGTNSCKLMGLGCLFVLGSPPMLCPHAVGSGRCPSIGWRSSGFFGLFGPGLLGSLGGRGSAWGGVLGSKHGVSSGQCLAPYAQALFMIAEIASQSGGERGKQQTVSIT